MMKLKPLVALILMSTSVGATTINEVESLGSSVDENSGDFNSFMADYIGESWDDDAAKQANTAAPAKEVQILNVDRESAPDVMDKTVQQVIDERMIDPPQTYNEESSENTEEWKYVLRHQNGKLLDEKSSDGIYASNIPQTSAMVFQSDFRILPYRNTAYFHNGKRVYYNPLKANNDDFSNSLTTFCKLDFVKFEIGRQIDEGQHFGVKKVRYKESEMKFAVHGAVTIRELKIDLDNNHLKSLHCLSTDKTRPMTIGNIRYETGGLIDFKLRDFVGI